MRRAIAMVACLGIASPVLADPDAQPHPIDPLPAEPDTTRPQPPPPDNATKPPPPPAPSTFVPPAVNPALPIVTLSTMPIPIYARAPDTEPRTAAWIATGVAAAFAIAMEGWWLYRETFEQRGIGLYSDPRCHVLTGLTNPACYVTTPEDVATKNHNEHVWNLTELSFGAGLGLSGFVAGYLWSRHFHPLQQVGFTPANGGGAVWIRGQL